MLLHSSVRGLLLCISYKLNDDCSSRRVEVRGGNDRTCAHAPNGPPPPFNSSTTSPPPPFPLKKCADSFNFLLIRLFHVFRPYFSCVVKGFGLFIYFLKRLRGSGLQGYPRFFFFLLEDLVLGAKWSMNPIAIH